MGVVVAYPGIMPAASAAARAFLDAGLLARYEGTFVYHPHSSWASLVRAIPGAKLREKAQRQFHRRALEALPLDKISQRPGRDLLRTAASRTGLSAALLDRLWEWTVLDFDRSVAARLGGGDKAVYGYEHACLATFERAAQLGMPRVFDMAAPHYSFAQRLHEEELAICPGLATAHWRGTRSRSAMRNARKQAELDAASLVVANSAFTARTLVDTGYPRERVRVVPLGAPQIDPSWRDRARGEKVRFLFAGPASVRKGVHRLLSSWRELGGPRRATLTLAGQWNVPGGLRRALPGDVRILGSIPQPQLFSLYRCSSVLVLPSMCDGFGMVVTEALAHGLPVITTTNVGAADLIEPGKNGFVIEPRDTAALTERMRWCIDHPDELRAMREAAEATAAQHQWSDYRSRLVATVTEALWPHGRPGGG